jgi:GMP synthase (glutamine-hydrolysing)
MIFILRHGKDEGPGLISDLLGEAMEEYRTIRMSDGELFDGPLPRGLIILGGPMSATDIRSNPFFLIEHELIRGMVALRRPVLGICLGAQLIAAAFGAAVYPAATAERGWYRVFRVNSAADSMIPKTMSVFQWHSDTFDLPAGARLMVRGDPVPNQMFSIGSAIAVQFHPEVTPEMIDLWTKFLPREERAGILGETPLHLEESNNFCGKLVMNFLKPEIHPHEGDHHPRGFAFGSPMDQR